MTSFLVAVLLILTVVLVGGAVAEFMTHNFGDDFYEDD